MNPNLLQNSKTLGQSIKFYNDAVVNVLDKHAPKKTTKIRVVENAPWFDNEYLNLRKERRRKERKFQKTKAEDDREAYLLLQKKATEMVKNKKKDYITCKLDSSPKDSHKIVKSLLDRKKETILPDAKSPTELAEDLRAFSVIKSRRSEIRLIRPILKQLARLSAHHLLRPLKISDLLPLKS